MDRSLQLSVVEDLRHPGVRRVVERHVPLEGLTTSVAAIDDGSDVDADLVVEVIGDDLVVSGSIHAHWRGECRRCLEGVTGELEVSVREIFEPRPVEGETYPLVDGIVDLEPMIREAVLLALPLAPLCSQGCAGPDPDRFPTLGGDTPSDAEQPRDPRWAALDELRFDVAVDEPDEADPV